MNNQIHLASNKTTAIKSHSNFSSQLAFLIVSFIGLLSFSVTALETTQIEELTQQWLSIEKQSAQLEKSWQEQQPTLSQQLLLLKEEKTQLIQMLNADNTNQEQVEVKRSELLAKQSELESQQQNVSEKITSLNKTLLQLNDLLPPPLSNAWANEEHALGVDPAVSKKLQVALAKLAKLSAFNQRISVHEMPIISPRGNEILVKQFYLGASNAWFTSANGEYRGWGQPSNNGWHWHFDQQLNADAITNAIAIFEKKKQADFVSLPITLAPVNAETTIAQKTDNTL